MRSCQIYCITKESDIGRMRHLNSHVSGIMTFGYLWARIWNVNITPDCIILIISTTTSNFGFVTRNHGFSSYTHLHMTSSYFAPVIIPRHTYLLHILLTYAGSYLEASENPVALKWPFWLGRLTSTSEFTGSVCSNTFCAAVASQEPLATASLVPFSFWFPEHLRTKRTQWNNAHG